MHGISRRAVQFVHIRYKPVISENKKYVLLERPLYFTSDHCLIVKSITVTSYSFECVKVDGPIDEIYNGFSISIQSRIVQLKLSSERTREEITRS